MVIILYLWYIQKGAPKLLLMAQLLKHPQSESVLVLILKSFLRARACRSRPDLCAMQSSRLSICSCFILAIKLSYLTAVESVPTVPHYRRYYKQMQAKVYKQTHYCWKTRNNSSCLSFYVSEWVPSTHYRSFRRRVFPVNHLHWYWHLTITTKRQNTQIT